VASGTGNAALGINAASNYTSSESNNITIGNAGTAGESGVIRIGATQTKTFVAGIFNVPISNGSPVLVDSFGQIGTMSSSLRFKEDVEDMGKASAALMQLRPVVFHYKPSYDDGSHILQYGLIAEEVAKVYPNLVQYDNEGQPLAVRYHLINAMLLNEVQKQHAQIEEQAAEIASLKANTETSRRQAAKQAAEIDEQRGRLEILEARLARLETGTTSRR
jgi:hypothetical protein